MMMLIVICVEKAMNKRTIHCALIQTQRIYTNLKSPQPFITFNIPFTPKDYRKWFNSV